MRPSEQEEHHGKKKQPIWRQLVDGVAWSLGWDWEWEQMVFRRSVCLSVCLTLSLLSSTFSLYDKVLESSPG